MTDLRKRNVGEYEEKEVSKNQADVDASIPQHESSVQKLLSNSVEKHNADDDDDGDMLVEPDFDCAEPVPTTKEMTTEEAIDARLKDVSPRWRNWIIRGIFTWVMICGFGAVVLSGPLVIVLLKIVVAISFILLMLSGILGFACIRDQRPPRKWRNWIIRSIFTFMMISSFSFVVYLGPISLVVLILLIQIKCFHEIITIGYSVYKSHDLPWFRTLSWFFLVTSNYFFYGESMMQYFGVLMSRTEFLNPLVVYHRFFSFSLYVSGLCGFVFSLVKKNYLKQFIMFGWTHVTLLIIVTQSHLFMQNVFEGIIWFLVPVSMIICNDIMAYMFGFFFGRTPLIKLSPKKTWEGFIGGAFSTVIFGLIISSVLCQFDYFVCPVEYDDAKEALSMECERTSAFRLHEFGLPEFIQKIGILFGQNWKSVTLYPFLLHSISLSLFASVIGPFGGFFASGFKRAFRIKDFGDTIPGHGGFMDRFDCQLLMATFVHVYHSSFIKAVSPQRLVQQIISLKPEQQLQVFTMLQEVLIKRGLLDSITAQPVLPELTQ